METTVMGYIGLHRGYIGIMEKKMETIIMVSSSIRKLSLSWENEAAVTGKNRPRLEQPDDTDAKYNKISKKHGR